MLTGERPASTIGNDLVIYTDGGCRANPNGMAAWACWRTWHGLERLWGGRMGIASNNAAELEAVLQALRSVPPGGKVTIYSDSMYVVGTITSGWRRRANHDRWAVVEELLAGRQVTCCHIAGHSGIHGNELVDLAVNHLLGRKLTPGKWQLIKQLTVVAMEDGNEPGDRTIADEHPVEGGQPPSQYPPVAYKPPSSSSEPRPRWRAAG